ncbi:hypothetical protein V8C40DRAFT_250269 [Trichoderma camerunense]
MARWICFRVSRSFSSCWCLVLVILHLGTSGHSHQRSAGNSVPPHASKLLQMPTFMLVSPHANQTGLRLPFCAPI